MAGLHRTAAQLKPSVLSRCERANVLATVTSSQLVGRNRRAQQSLPEVFLKQINRENDGIYILVMELNAFLRGPLDNLAACREVITTLGNLGSVIYDSGGTGNPEASPQAFAKANKAAGTFVALGGADALVEIIYRLPSSMSNITETTGQRRHATRVALQQAKILNETIGVTRELIFIYNHLADSGRCGSDRFLLHLFLNLLKGHTFDTTVGLLEEILSTRPVPFCLDKVVGIHGILRSFSIRQLALFTRIFALLVFEPESAKEAAASNKKTHNSKAAAADESDDSDFAVFSSPTTQQSVANPLAQESSSPGSPTTSAISPSGNAKHHTTPSSSSRTRKKATQCGPTRIPLLVDKGARRRKACNIVDRNQAVLVFCPGLLRRMVALLEMAIEAYPATHAYQNSMSQSENLNPTQQMLMMFSSSAPANGGYDWADYDEPGMGAPDSSELSARQTVSDTFDGLGSGSITSMLMAIREAMEQNGFDSSSQIAEEVAAEAVANEIDEMNTLSAARGGNGPTPPRANVKQMTISAHLVEILFTVGILCAGKGRHDLQERLMTMNLGSILNRLFGVLNWEFEPRQDHGPHGEGCQCNPTSAVKVQFLRVTHNFCERDDMFRAHKLQVLSKKQCEARETIRRLLSSGKVDAALECVRVVALDKDGDKGLLQKLIGLLINQTEDAYAGYRFWLATCVESFLRLAPVEDQLIVSSTPGLFEHLVKDLTESVGADCHGLQTNFDLLGELVKFNSLGLAKLDSTLDEKTFLKLFDVVFRNLVDSNVFIRSLLLTCEFESIPAEDFQHDGFETRRFLGTFAQNTRFRFFLQEQRLKLFGNLCTVIEVGDISQENLCCLNTTLMILVFAHRKGEMKVFIDSLSDLEKQWNSPGSVLTNFRRLLWFWRRYYFSRGHDRVSLENSSRIPFPEYVFIVDILCADDDSTPCSLFKSKQWAKEWDYLAERTRRLGGRSGM